MSEDKKAEATVCCASCCIAEIDDIKLMECDGCDLVKYCGDECQENHKSEHADDCKKRASELRDELLFKIPESSHLGDCPICSLPLPLEMKKSSMMSCCSKVICRGCSYANQKREREASMTPSCPFCRKPIPKTDEGVEKQNMKRVEANDPAAMYQEGMEQYEKGDYHRAFGYYTKAAELGSVEAHSRLADFYHYGLGVEKDEEKKIHHLEEAAIGGHPLARRNLGAYEWDIHNNAARAVKHWIIAAAQGEDHAIKSLMKTFKSGLLEKEVLEASFRAHKAAVDATKSPQRKAAEE